MKRIAIIGENSIEFINVLLNVWNNGDCAVIIDWRIPSLTAYEMMLDAEVELCYIQNDFADEFLSKDYFDILFEVYENKTHTAIMLPSDIYTKHHTNYNKTEALVIYSSGTTGKSKGVILSHYAINSNADAIQDYMKLSPDDDVLYIVKSLSHSSTMIGELLVGLKYKIPMVIAPTIVPPRYVLNKIQEFHVTTIALNPTLLTLYAADVKRKAYNLQSLKTIYVSGSILDDKIYDLAHTAFKGVAIYNVYGLSEAGPRVAAQRKDCCKTNSVGLPIKGVELVIVDDNGHISAQGTNGVVHVKTCSKYLGYVSGKEKYESLYKNWLNTGDVGFIDRYGELHIVSRTDDLIIIDAHKIYPNEIEQIIIKEFSVRDCMICKRESEFGDHLICIYENDYEINDMQSLLRNKLLPYEIPRMFYKTEKIPKNSNGKKLRSVSY